MYKLPDLPKFARHDPMICGARGLFRSLPRGTRDQPLEIEHQHGQADVCFRSQVRFGCDDLRILQAVTALANTSHLAIRSDCKTDAYALRTALHLTPYTERMDVLLVKTSYARLSMIAGYGSERGGAMMAQIRASLERLAQCEINIATNGEQFGWRLLAWDELELGRERLRIALNPRSSRCAHGVDRFTLINMDEARRFQHDATRLCHQRLSTFVDAAPSARLHAPKKPVRVTSKTLEEYAWGCEALQLSSAAKRQRLCTLSKVLDELRSANWIITLVGVDLYEISRSIKKPMGMVAAKPFYASDSHPS